MHRWTARAFILCAAAGMWACGAHAAVVEDAADAVGQTDGVGVLAAVVVSLIVVLILLASNLARHRRWSKSYYGEAMPHAASPHAMERGPDRAGHAATLLEGARRRLAVGDEESGRRRLASIAWSYDRTPAGAEAAQLLAELQTADRVPVGEADVPARSA